MQLKLLLKGNTYSRPQWLFLLENEQNKTCCSVILAYYYADNFSRDTCQFYALQLHVTSAVANN